MDSPNFSEDRVAKYVVVSIAIIGLIVVTWIDVNSTDTRVPDVAYWILGGAILGAENIIKILRK